jgi:hypothetical protein
MLEFVTVTEESSKSFDKRVNDLLADGWELRGDTFTRGSSYNGYHSLCQVLVRIKDKERKEI